VEQELDLDLDPELSRRNVAIGAAVVVGALLLASAAVAATFEAPQVGGVQSEFGTVTDEEAAIETTITVRNPNGAAIPGGVDLRYTVFLNDVAVASGAATGVDIEPGNNTVETTAGFDNSKIPAWWVTHVNGNESSVMTTRADVGVAGLPVGPTLTPERQEIETNFLGPLATENASRVSLNETDLLVVGNQSGRWGGADAERTPLVVENDLENVHERPVTIDGADYEIRMNGVVVGQGETDEGITLQPGESATYDVEAAIDTQRMQQWWVSHLRNDETTNLTIEMYAVAEVDGERERLPLTIYEQRAVFETDFLGSGATSVQPLEGESGSTPEFASPTVEGTDSEWGGVRDEETDVRTTVRVRNPADEAYADLLSLVVDRRTTIAGVTVAEGTERVADLPQGSGAVDVVTTKPHSVVPEWWAAHLANGERSERRTELDADADVAITTLPVDLADSNSTVETATLAYLNDGSTRGVESEESGRRLLTVHSTSAEYVDPTPERATVVVRADVENEDPLSSVTIRDVDYTVAINDVTLADRTAPESHTLAPGERRTVEFTLVLNNSRMAAWWPTHIRGGETSQLSQTATATVETDRGTERVELEFLSGNRTVETDLLAD
jgi:LEA14-like dessication related protein